ncbi:hypothetical protein FA15DRAFT_706337 [Coprinopsis marcescibilis]|uniref:Uncharacterized protein n=1 Tax=Coprinopsis marcescibilis TaxID=230819 RepID=A0A5C3L2R6_COPMA|nr:hypothetical protein FA15DRAFT_706337 [Coprinopsis marcescibilis]
MANRSPALRPYSVATSENSDFLRDPQPNFLTRIESASSSTPLGPVAAAGTKSRRGRKLVIAALILLGLILIVLAIVLPVYFTVIKPRNEKASGNRLGNIPPELGEDGVRSSSQQPTATPTTFLSTILETVASSGTITSSVTRPPSNTGVDPTDRPILTTTIAGGATVTCIPVQSTHLPTGFVPRLAPVYTVVDYIDQSSMVVGRLVECRGGTP